MFFAETKYDFNKLTSSLKFQDSFESAAELLAGHLVFVHRLLGQFLQTSPYVAPPDREAISSLPQESIVRILSSPYLCELLMILYGPKVQEPSAVQSLSLQLLQGLIAEIQRVRPDYTHTLRPRWSFNGDLVLDPQVAAKFPALHTRCGIQLNYQSYIHNTQKEGIGGYDCQSASMFRERIETAKSLVGSASRGALSLIEQFTLVIQFRHNKNKFSVINSSTHTSIGLIRTDNFHRLHKDLPEIVDMLVHESIHQYLHLFEEQLCSFVKVEELPPELLESRLFASPWSGHLLDLRSYTHAILVWYGLIHFWGQFLDQRTKHAEISRAQALQKLQEAELGFRNSRSVLDNLHEAISYLHPDFILQIERIQRELSFREAM